MNKLSATLIICFTLLLCGFATWQMFLGNFEAAFSSLPFLVIVYLFVAPWKKRHLTTQSDGEG